MTFRSARGDTFLFLYVSFSPIFPSFLLLLPFLSSYILPSFFLTVPFCNLTYLTLFDFFLSSDFSLWPGLFCHLASLCDLVFLSFDFSLWPGLFLSFGFFDNFYLLFVISLLLFLWLIFVIRLLFWKLVHTSLDDAGCLQNVPTAVHW